MAEVLIVRTGATLEQLRAPFGDFHDWFREGMGLDEAGVDVVSPFEGEALPEPGAHRAVVVTGSSAMVTDRANWSERTARWLRELVEQDAAAVLGVCYGHQLLAHALGGEVGDNPRGRQIGSFELELLPAGRRDPLLGVLPPRFLAQETHVQSVLRPPGDAVVLARDTHDAHQALRYGPRAWSVQFHPEMTAAMLAGYVRHRAELLRREGLDPEERLRSLRDGEHGPRLLRRFVALATEAPSLR